MTWLRGPGLAHPNRSRPCGLCASITLRTDAISRRCRTSTDFLAHHRPPWSEVRWIHIAGPCDPALARAFADKYELHPLAIEDVLNLDQRPKAEDFAFSEDHPGRLFIIARAVARKGDHVETEQVSFFLGRKTLVSFEEKEPDLLLAVESRIRDRGSRLRQHDVSFLLYCMLDHLVDSFFPILEEISVNLDGIETAVLENSGTNVLPDIYRFRRDLSLLRRVAWPMRELIFKLHRETHVCLSETTATYLRDVYDHLVQVQDLLETYREFADSLTQTYMSLVSNRMNDIMKTLTIVSTIFVPLTFLAGVYGMNMPIPENEKGLVLSRVLGVLCLRGGWHALYVPPPRLDLKRHSADAEPLPAMGHDQFGSSLRLVCFKLMTRS